MSVRVAKGFSYYVVLTFSETDYSKFDERDYSILTPNLTGLDYKVEFITRNRDQSHYFGEDFQDQIY